MNRTAFVIAVGLVACGGKPDSAPKTTYFTTEAHLMTRWAALCDIDSRLQFRGIHDGSSPSEWSTRGRARCRLKEEHGRSSLLPIETFGTSGLDSKICSVRIGPGPVATAVSLDFVPGLIDDPELAARVRSAIGDVDTNYEYEISVMVDGLALYLEQFPALDGPNIEIRINGCGRAPDHTSTHAPMPGNARGLPLFGP
jgi:hypothetical protein